MAKNTMKAAALTGIGKIEVGEVPLPRIEQPADVLLRIEAVGVCGSDMHYYRKGRIGGQVVKPPWTIGHECAGVVVELGRDVQSLSVGQPVAVDPLIWCDQCDQCLAGRWHTCRSQKFLGAPGQKSGCLAEYLVMPAKSCFPVPQSMTMVQGAMVEPLSIGLYAQRLSGGTSGKSVAILGCGPIGLSVLKSIRAEGPCTVYMTDVRDYRLDFARSSGADWTGNPRGADVVCQMLKAQPLGMDFVFECAGEQETLDQGVELLKPGGKMLMVGILEADSLTFSADPLRRKELSLQNVRRQNECVQDAIDLVASGKVVVDDMVTHEFALADVSQAFDTVADYRDGAIKAIIRLTT